MLSIQEVRSTKYIFRLFSCLDVCSPKLGVNFQGLLPFLIQKSLYHFIPLFIPLFFI